MSRFVRVTSFAPDIQGTVLEGRQPEGTQLKELARAVRAMLGMKKIDIAELRAAYEGKWALPDLEE